MIPVKSNKADLENKRVIFFEIGIILSLLSCWLFLGIKQPINHSDFLGSSRAFNLTQEEVINTLQPTPPPPAPKPQPMLQTTMISIVEDEEEVEQELVFSVDADMNTEVMPYVIPEPVLLEEEEEAEIPGEIFIVVEQDPSFPGGMLAMKQYLSREIKYPELARELKITGLVFVSFVVEPDGSISQVKVLRGIGGGCDEEALRVVKNMPRWEPGRQRGKAVRVQYNLPVRFTLL